MQDVGGRKGPAPAVLEPFPRGLVASDEEVPRALRLALSETASAMEEAVVAESGVPYDIHAAMRQVEAEMLQAAQALEFERAAILRDELADLRRQAGLPEKR